MSGNDGNAAPEAGAENESDEAVINTDYSEQFRILVRFSSVEEAFQHALEIARRIGFNLVKASNTTDKFGVVRNTVRCDRWGEYISRADPNTPSPRKNLSSKKCGCDFAIQIKSGRRNTNSFLITPKHGFHNHTFLPYLDGHRRFSAMTPEVKTNVVQQHKGGAAPRHIRACLEHRIDAEAQAVGERRTGAPNSKMIYNTVYQKRAEERGDRTRAQEMLRLAVEKQYIFFTAQSETSNSMVNCFMCHPEAAKMYRAYPYVVVMDSTYKTNKYNRALVQMVGVSPVGLNFLIAWALVENETERCYTWVLECLRKLLPAGVEPSVIVTDRELGLGGAIRAVFPGVNHMLCIWHIYKNVEARAGACMRHKALAATCAYEGFGAMVRAKSSTACDDAWRAFQIDYESRQPLIEYIAETWCTIREKWAWYSVNQMFHLGNHASSRVEAAHAALKLWLHASTTACDSLWTRVHDMWEGQQAEVRKLLSDSVGKNLVKLPTPYSRLFGHMHGKVTHKAITLMKEEFKRGLNLGSHIRRNCGCTMPRTHGLPCACMLHDVNSENGRVSLRSVHVFWKTFVYGDNPVAPYDVTVARQVLIDRIMNVDPAVFPDLEEVFDRYLHPEREDIDDPEVAQQRRGRPRNPPRTSTRRNPSHHEHVASRHPDPPAREQPTMAHYTQYANGPNESCYLTTSSVRTFPYWYLLPGWFRAYYVAYFDPVGDGHCGFRCLSHAMFGYENNWQQMRRELRREIRRTDVGYYGVIYGTLLRVALDRIRWTGGGGHCDDTHWMENEDLFAFATLHAWTVCVVSRETFHGQDTWMGSATFLPLYAEDDIAVPLGEIWLLHDGGHWRRLRVDSNTPMPPIYQSWNLVGARDLSTERFRAHYQDRLDMWECAMSL